MISSIEFLCPHCRCENKINRSDFDDVSCQKCCQKISFNDIEETESTGQVGRCAICENDGFYLQKDFNPRLGVIIFAIGVIFSYHTNFLSLFIATAIDFIMYYILSTVTVCYQCRAIYRGFTENPDHGGFSHLKALEYSKTAT